MASNTRYTPLLVFLNRLAAFVRSRPEANGGEIVAALHQIISHTATGSVTGYGTPGLSSDNPDNPNSCPTPLAMPGVQVRVTDGAQNAQTYANGDGVYELFDSENEFSVESSLVGEWCTINNQAGDDLHVYGLSTLSSPDVDLVFNEAADQCFLQDQQQFATAQVNAFVHVQRTHDWFRGHVPDPFESPGIDSKCER